MKKIYDEEERKFRKRKREVYAQLILSSIALMAGITSFVLLLINICS